MRNWVLLNIPFWIAAAFTGAVAVMYQKLFSLMEHTSWGIVSEHRWSIFLITPICFLLSWWIVHKWAPNAKGSGIPQVMASLELAKPGHRKYIRHLLGFKILILKIIASSIKAFGGGVIGREGPTIQIGASILMFINKVMPRWIPRVSMYNAILAGGASGLAAAFNTPLGGIVFAIEELAKGSIKNFKTALFTGVIISGIIAQMLGGSYLYFGYPKLGDIQYSSVIVVIMVALIAGLSGGAFGKIALYFSGIFSSLQKNWSRALFILICALVVATPIFFWGLQAFGSGKDMMDTLLFSDQKKVEWYTPLIRMTGMIASFVSSGAGGIFAPSLSAGAAIGAEMSALMGIKGNTANLLILCGMIGFLTGVTRSPITSAIIVLEMTDRHSSILFFMLAAVVANIASSAVDRKSIYEHIKVGFLKDMYALERKEREAHQVALQNKETGSIIETDIEEDDEEEDE